MPLGKTKIIYYNLSTKSGFYYLGNLDLGNVLKRICNTYCKKENKKTKKEKKEKKRRRKNKFKKKTVSVFFPQ